MSYVYRKRPVEIQAIQLLWTTWNEMCDFVNVGYLVDSRPEGGYAIPRDSTSFEQTNLQPTDKHVLALMIPTLEGVMVGFEGDWIIKGVQGELYPCKPDIFDATYEAVE